MPPPSGFTVNPAELRAAAGTTAVHADDAVNQLGLVHTATGHAAETVGNLEAADAILRFGARWDRQLQGLAELIASLQAGLDVSAEVYEQTDQDAAASLQRSRP
jgi:uncharacterized protein YukE